MLNQSGAQVSLKLPDKVHVATPILIDCVRTAMVEHLILLGISGGFCRNGINFYTILLNAQPSGAGAKIVPILNRFCVIAAGCTA